MLITGRIFTVAIARTIMQDGEWQGRFSAKSRKLTHRKRAVPNKSGERIMNRLAIAAISLCAATAVAQTNSSPTKSVAEAAAVQAMLQAQTPDDQIRTAGELITKYSNTNYKAYALLTEAKAYEQKGDYAKSIDYCERALAVDPKDFDA